MDVPSPQEFADTKIIDIRGSRVRNFFRNTIAKNVFKINILSTHVLIQFILKDLLSVNENSDTFFEALITLLKENEVWTKDIEFINTLQEMIKRKFHKTAIIKLNELETLCKTFPEKNIEIDAINTLMKELTLNEKKSDNESSKGLSLIGKINELKNSISNFKINEETINSVLYIIKLIEPTFQDDLTAELTQLSSFLEKIDKIKENSKNFQPLQPSSVLDITIEEREKESNEFIILPKNNNGRHFKQISKSARKKQQRKEIKESEKEKEAESPQITLQPSQVSEQKTASRRRRKRKKVNNSEPEKENIPERCDPSNLFAPLPNHKLFSSKNITCDSRVNDWYSKEPPALKTDQYKRLSTKRKEEEILFHSFPTYITKIGLIWGEKSMWSSDNSQEKKPHYSLLGQIECEGGHTYQGVFTDCFDANNRNILFHHHFVQRKYNISIDDHSRQQSFQPNDELQYALLQEINEDIGTRELLDEKGRFEIIQQPGLVTIHDTIKRIRYTVILNSLS